MNACENINMRIRNYLNKTVLEKIKVQPVIDGKIDMNDITKDIIKKCSKQEKLFISKFVQTQMFVTLIEDNYCKMLESKLLGHLPPHSFSAK